MPAVWMQTMSRGFTTCTVPRQCCWHQLLNVDILTIIFGQIIEQVILILLNTKKYCLVQLYFLCFWNLLLSVFGTCSFTVTYPADHTH